MIDWISTTLFEKFTFQDNPPNSADVIWHFIWDRCISLLDSRLSTCYLPAHLPGCGLKRDQIIFPNPESQLYSTCYWGHNPPQTFLTAIIKVYNFFLPTAEQSSILVYILFDKSWNKIILNSRQILESTKSRKNLLNHKGVHLPEDHHIVLLSPRALLLL